MKFSKSVTIINGKRYEGSSVVVTNGRVIIDGKEVTDKDAVKDGILKIKVEGVLQNLTTDANVEAGLIQGNVDAGGSVSCDDVEGDVDAGGSVNCGNVGGNVDAGGSVNAGKVGGDVDAGGSVIHA